MKCTHVTGMLMSVFLLFYTAAFSRDTIDTEQMGEAVSITFQAFSLANMLMIFDQAPPGCTEEDGSLIFSDVNIAALGIDEHGLYTTISGTFTYAEHDEGSTLRADLVLAGGPITRLEWELSNFNDDDSGGYFVITADCQTYRIDYTGDFDEE